MRLRPTLLFAWIIATPSSALAQTDDFVRTISVPTPDTSSNLRGGGQSISNIIYVNDCMPTGCFVAAGDEDNAIDDVSIVPPRNSVLSPFNHPPEVWDQTMTCIREVFAPYNVEIVTTNPGNVPHHEAILAGSGAEFDLPPDVLGIAPFNCNPQDNAMSFAFANSMEPDWLRMCWTVAQETAHAFGLEHAFDCRDPMTYLDGNCGQKFFRKLDFECGEFEAGDCQCTPATQNSHNALIAVFGPGAPSASPEVSIGYPADQAAVDDEFVVSMVASDPRQIHRIEVYVNDWLYQTLEAHNYIDRDDPYVFDPPDSLPEGRMNIEVIAYNDLDLSASASISVTKGALCGNDDACLLGQECRDGGCYWPTPTGALGATCESAMDCESLLCPQSGETRVCSQYCEFGFQGQCPANFQCVPLSDTPSQAVCWPLPQADDGCQASAGSPTWGHVLLLLAAAFLATRRRRARVVEA